ncbi:hypothetical protein OAF27_03145 [Verrucomicrobiales bacterium]|nr:hypothetical protein [Verrucomicrobiales bacterium]
MPIKQKKSSRDGAQPKDRPHWDDKEGAVPGESPDARIRRMSMQMASAERSGFRGERSDLYGGLPMAAVWAIRLAAAAVVVVGIFAVSSLFRSKGTTSTQSPSSNEDAIEALIRAASEKPEDPVSATPEVVEDDPFEWIPTSDESFKPFREAALAFFEASTSEELRPLVIPTPDVEKRLKDSSDDALFDQISAPTFANNYCAGEGWVTVDALLPAYGFRPIIIRTTDGENLIDLDAFLGYNPKSTAEISEDLENGQEVTFRALAALSFRAADTPGDLLVVLREPNDTLLLGEQIVARLSKFGNAPDHILDWLGKGQPLPFTVTVAPELSLTGESLLRISDIRADAWSSGLTPSPVTLAPPSKIDDNGAE